MVVAHLTNKALLAKFARLPFYERLIDDYGFCSSDFGGGMGAVSLGDVVVEALPRDVGLVVDVYLLQDFDSQGNFDSTFYDGEMVMRYRFPVIVDNRNYEYGFTRVLKIVEEGEAVLESLLSAV